MPDRTSIRKDSSTAVLRLTMLAALASVLVVVSLPFGYFLAVYYHEGGVLESEAQTDSFFVSRLASDNPVLWQYQQHRLEDILDRRPRGGTKESRSVFGRDGNLIAKSADVLEPPMMRRTYPILDAGMPVGTIEVSSSLRPMFIRTALVALLSTLLGSIIYYLIRVLPIRSVQKAEEQLQHYARELEETNVDLQSFIFSLSHDLRTPLVTIKGFAGELAHALKDHEQMIKQQMNHFEEQQRKRIEETLHDEIPETLGFIDMASDKMSNMISGVLKLSQVHQLKLKPQVIDMDQLVHTVLVRFQAAIKRRNVTINYAGLPPLIADRIAVEEVMGHLLDNAIKFLLPDRPGMVEVSGRRSSQETVFSIRDNGRGIAQEDLPKIFGLFRRAGQQSILGEGMGLVYVKALVRRHNGRIWCESTVGSGTTISFAIPLKTPIGQYPAIREENMNHDEPDAGDHSSGRG